MPILLSVPHATNHVPARFRSVFASQQARAALDSHRGIDFGAAALAKQLQKRLAAPLTLAKMTRLLVDLNRSARHRKLLSEWSRLLPPALVLELRAHHAAYVENEIARVRQARGPVTHVAIHSFTPRLGADIRKFDVGLLYDPSRPRERALAWRLRTALREAGLTVRLNAPYRGSADGLPTTLRHLFPDRRYAGLELEVNQAILLRGRDRHKQSSIVQVLSEQLARI